MKKLTKKRSTKAGLPPGTLVHIGEKKGELVKISVLDYDSARLLEREVKTVEECLPFKDEPTITWINVEGLHETEVVRKFGEHFGFHPLVQEDILNTDQRPKMEDYGDYLYVVVKMLTYNGATNEIAAEQISLILGRNFVITFQEGKEGDVFDPLRDQIRTGKGRIRNSGADYLAYAMIDSIVDTYFIILEKLGERIEELEDKLVSEPTAGTLHLIHLLKRELIYLRKSVWPLREVISGMQRGQSSLIRETTLMYLRDIYDHTIQVIDSIETYRDMVAGMLEIYLSSVSNRLNSVMKVLTIIATIFIPLTFIVGVYGMNFHYMPELDWRLGYPVLWTFMILIAVGMLIFFRKRKWL